MLDYKISPLLLYIQNEMKLKIFYMTGELEDGTIELIAGHMGNIGEILTYQKYIIMCFDDFAVLSLFDANSNCYNIKRVQF